MPLAVRLLAPLDPISLPLAGVGHYDWRSVKPIASGRSAPSGAASALYGRLVNNPPMKNPNPRIESQCGQEYMISFLITPETSR